MSYINNRRKELLFLCIMMALAVLILNLDFEIENQEEEFEIHTVVYPATVIRPYDYWEWELTDNEHMTLCYIISGEVGNLSLESKLAVASCLYNACRLEDMQPSGIRIAYRYAGWKENLESESPKDWEEINHAIERVFKYGEVLDEEMLYFYNPNICKSMWHESMKYITTIDGQRYFGLNN